MTRPKPRNVDPIKAGQEGIGFLVNQTSRAFGQRMSKEIGQFNIQLPGYVVLRHLVREVDAGPATIGVSELARKVLLEPRDIIEASERLERDGWLKVEGTGTDATLRPTAKAFRVAPVLYAASHWMLAEALNGFSRDEIEQLSGLLARILRNLDAPLGADEGPLEV